MNRLRVVDRFERAYGAERGSTEQAGFALEVPGCPNEVRQAGGSLIFSGEQIRRGQQAWLHREATALQDILAVESYGFHYAELPDTPRTVIDRRVRSAMRGNPYDPATGSVSLSEERTKAVFGRDGALRAVVRQ